MAGLQILSGPAAAPKHVMNEQLKYDQQSHWTFTKAEYLDWHLDIDGWRGSRKQQRRHEY